jgi:serine protein kinase
MTLLTSKYASGYKEKVVQGGVYWKGGFSQYEEIVKRNPLVLRNAFQRVYDMIISWGLVRKEKYKEKVTHYNFFDDIGGDGGDAIFGLDEALMALVRFFESAYNRYGTEKRVLLLHGPVGSSKSTIARLLKKGLELYSATPEGALYAFSFSQEAYFYGLNNEKAVQALSLGQSHMDCPMHEEPLHLIPKNMRRRYTADLLDGHEKKEELLALLDVEGELCPVCRFVFNNNMERYEGDFAKFIDEHVVVRRLVLNEADRVGIGSFQPKDEKNQDSTDLTGDVNYRNIAALGKDSDPRAFNFDGEFQIASRGMIEFAEVLKLDVAFLYDLLGASQEHKIKPKKFSQTDLDTVILGHTNEPEYKKLQNNEFMEALRDRTIKIDIPYVTRLSDEIKIYERDFNPRRVNGKHIAPHTIEMAAIWAVLTRLDDPKIANLTLMQKMKLYNGQMLPGFTEENVRELRSQSNREGMVGISPRYIQDKISNALVAHPENNCINPFMVFLELENGLRHHSLIKSEDTVTHYISLIADVKQEYEEIVKNEVQIAISADEDALKRLCGNYIDHVKSYTQKQKVKNKFTNQMEEPDERLMRSIESKIDITENRKDDFRRELMNYIAYKTLEGEVFDYKSNERLHKALKLKLIEEQKDTVRLTSLISGNVDPETQAKIDVLKTRLIKNYAYCEKCADDILTFVASIFARGEPKK